MTLSLPKKTIMCVHRIISIPEFSAVHVKPSYPYTGVDPCYRQFKEDSTDLSLTSNLFESQLNNDFLNENHQHPFRCLHLTPGVFLWNLSRFFPFGRFVLLRWSRCFLNWMMLPWPREEKSPFSIDWYVHLKMSHLAAIWSELENQPEFLNKNCLVFIKWFVFTWKKS